MNDAEVLRKQGATALGRIAGSPGNTMRPDVAAAVSAVHARAQTVQASAGANRLAPSVDAAPEAEMSADATTNPTGAPAWLIRDVSRNAKWLPATIRSLGISAAYQQRLSALPPDIQQILTAQNIPHWMIALIPTDPSKQDEICKQFRFSTDLAGTAPTNQVSARAEQLLLFSGSAHLPTPGDNRTGASLGAEGCSASISHYVLAQLKREFPQELAGMSDALLTSQSSADMKTLFAQAAKAGAVDIQSVAYGDLKAEDIEPGTITIAQKPGGTHVFAWTRVARGWRWDPSDKMAVGNTGLPQFGDRIILAQEYITGNPDAPGESDHNQHGPINGGDVQFANGAPDLSNPGTNVYAVEGANFILVKFHGPR